MPRSASGSPTAAMPDPTPTTDPAGAQPPDITESTRWLEQEIEATTDKSAKARLLYELGELFEMKAGDETRAVKSYVASVNADPSFRPPLFNLHRIFTLRRSFKNLVRILDAKVRATPAGPDKARALAARAELAEDHLDDVAGARKGFEDAHAEAPNDVSILLALERFATIDGDVARLVTIVEKMLASTTHPALRATLAGELARLSEASGNVSPDELAGRWARARSDDAAPWSNLSGAERFAIKAERTGDLVEAIVVQARRAEAVAKGTPIVEADALRFAGPEEATREAVGLFRRAARLLEGPGEDLAGAAKLVDQAHALAPEDLLVRDDRLRLADRLGDAARMAECVEAEMKLAPPPRQAAVLVEAALAARRRGQPALERELLVRAVDAHPGATTAAALLEAHLLAERDTEGLVQHRAIALAHTTDPGLRSARLAAAVDAAIGASRDVRAAASILAREGEPLSRDPMVLRTRVAIEHRLENWQALAEALGLLAQAAPDPSERLCALRDLAFVTAFRLSDRPAAIAACERAVAIEPSCRWALWLITDLGAEAGLQDKRAQAYERLADLAEDPDDAVGQLAAAAHAWSLAGRHDLALGCLQRADERAPGSALIEAMSNERLRALGRLAELVVTARRHADEAADPGSEQTQRVLGRAAVVADVLLGDAAAAAAFYQRLVDVAPDDPGAWFGLQRALEEAGDSARLARTLQSRIAEGQGTDTALAHLEVAERWEAAGRLDQAEASYARALEADPTLADALPGRLASAGVAGGRQELARVLESVRSSGSPAMARIADEELALIEGPEGEAIDRLAAREDAGPLHLLLRAYRAGAQGDVAARLLALSRLQKVTEGTPLAGVTLAMLARAGRVASSDDVVQAAARAMVAGGLAPRTLATTIADGLRPGLDDSIRTAALATRAERSTPKRRAELDIDRAEALEQSGRDEEAMALYRSMLEGAPDDLAALEGLRRTCRRRELWAELTDVCQRQAHLLKDAFAAAPMWEEAGVVLEDRLGDRKHAEACFRSALDGDMGRSAAYERLHHTLVARGAKRELASYVARRAEVVMEPEVLTALFWEHAELLRALGDREGALAALDNLLLLDEQHLPGLGMRAALLTELKRIPDAVEALGQLSDAEIEPEAKRAARLRAAELLEKNARDLPRAIAELWKLEAAGAADLAVYERVGELATRAPDVPSQLRALAALAEQRPDLAGRVAAERAISDIEAKNGNTAGSAAALRRLLALAPDDLPAMQRLAEIEVEPTSRATALGSAEAALRARLDRDCLDVAALHALAQAHALAGERDGRFLVTSILTAMGAATAAEAHDATTLRDAAPRRPSAPIGSGGLAALIHPEDRGAARNLWEALGESITAHYGLQPSALRLGRQDRINPKGVSPLRDEVVVWTGALSLGAVELYQGGPDARGVVPLPGQPPILVLGIDLAPPLPDGALFALGRAAWRLRRGTAAIHGRESDEIGALLFAAVRMVEPQVPAPPLLRLAEFQSSLPSSVPRKLRKGLTEPARAFATRPDHAQWVLAERHSANRAGALFARDPAVSLAAVAAGPTDEAALRRSRETVELVRFLLSREHGALRREIGLAIP